MSKKRLRPQMPELTPEQAKLQADIEASKQEITEAQDRYGRLLDACKHVLPVLTDEMKDHLRRHTEKSWGFNYACCGICGRGLGWRCTESPDGVCHYFTNDNGRVKLIDGTEVELAEPPDPDYESNDSCLFCASPQERK